MQLNGAAPAPKVVAKPPAKKPAAAPKKAGGIHVEEDIIFGDGWGYNGLGYAPYGVAGYDGYYPYDTLGYDVGVNAAYPYSDVYGYGAWGSPVAQPYLDLPDYTWITM